MKNKRSHIKTTLKAKKNWNLDSLDMLLVLESLSNKHLRSYPLPEKNISSYLAI
ncbi:hypothetical protein [Prochlorococcus marinus]|uniref:hypothetical protein n=1 Tax=Prochlorococcus marinus TaxID=1219 RepID=UPI001C57D7AF|nr:hypothetical protein [Prochlorococcus marinus]